MLKKLMGVIAVVGLFSCGVEANVSDTQDSAEIDEGALEAGGTTGIAACPGTGWLDPATWAGVEGTYLRMGVTPANEFSRLTISGTADALRYSRLVGFSLQTGPLRALPSNPAIGPVFSFFDNAGVVRDTYFVPYIRRSKTTGRVTSMCIGASSFFMLNRAY